MAADDSTFDRSGEAGIDPVAGEKQSRNRRFHRRPRRLAGATENVARFSRTTTARRSDAARAAGNAAVNSLMARSTSSWLPWPTSARAPLETSDRCELASPENRALVEHPLHRPARQPDERLCSITGRSNQRLTVTIGDAAVDSAARRTPSSAAGRSSKDRWTARTRQSRR